MVLRFFVQTYHFWSQVENRRSYNIASVRPSVRASVRAYGTAYLKNRSKDFFEIWHKVGEQNYKKCHTVAFLNFRRIKAGRALKGPKIQYLR